MEPSSQTLSRPELDPSLLAVALLFADVAPPDIAAPFTYVEVGRDHQNTQALRARHPHGTFHFLDVSQGQLENAPTSIDVLVINSVWAQTDTATRDAITRVMTENLSDNGVVVIDYATTPGATLPAVMHRMGLDLSEKAEAAQAFFFKANPYALLILDGMRGRNLDTHFHVASFQEMARTMSAANLQFVTPARLADAIPKLNFSREAALVLQNESNLVFREMTKDLMMNRGHRCDIFMRDPLKLDRQTAGEEIARTVFTTTLAPEKIEKLAVLTSYAEINPTESARRMFEVLGRTPASAMDLAQQRVPGCENVWKNVDSIMVLLAMEAIAPQALYPHTEPT